MPENPTAPSPDVQRLVDEKYAVSIEDQYIVVDNVPYVSAAGVISRAAIISAYHEKDGVEQFGDHTVWFTGSVPCTPNGESLANVLVADTNATVVAGRQAVCRFSYKSERSDTLDNIYNKLHINWSVNDPNNWEPAYANLFGVQGAGNIFPKASDLNLMDLRPAAGFGVHYKSPVGPIRVELGFNLARRELVPGTLERRTVLHISLGQAF